MATEWIKIEINTPDKPEVFAITSKMGWTDCDITVGKLFRLWRWFDQHTHDGNAPSVTEIQLDVICGAKGFSRALVEVGWLKLTSKAAILPNFNLHNGKTAKQRALANRRVTRHRDKTVANVTQTVLQNHIPEKKRIRSEDLRAGARVTSCDVEKDVENDVREIAALYPKIRDADNLSQEIQYAIAEAIVRDGRDLVWMGTKSMAEAVARWPKAELKFIPAAVRFFRESQYKTDPAEWVRSDGNGNAANPVNRDRAPSKQVERAFGNLAAVAAVFGAGNPATPRGGGAGVEHPGDDAGPGQAPRHGAAPVEILGREAERHS